MEQASVVPTATIRRVMQANRSRDTKPELAVRRAVHAKGLRYNVAQAPLAGVRRSADLVFCKVKVAVFVDGCFWHGCPEHYKEPKSNTQYWRAKIHRNQERDLETSEIFRLHGWTVMRFWSHVDPMHAAEQIERTVTQKRQTLGPGAVFSQQDRNSAPTGGIRSHA